MVGMNGACYAFEPIPAIRRQLCEKLAQAGLNNTVVLPFALSDKPGVASFNFVPNLPEESGLKKRHSYNAPPAAFEQIPVKVARLDETIPAAAKARFVKIDVEGGELDVLRGATRVLDEARPIVAFECGAASFMGYHDKPDAIFEIFASRGYAVHAITGTRIATAAEFHAASYRQEFWDYVAFPPGGEALAGNLRRN
jgi:FkbM family methyltransferase